MARSSEARHVLARVSGNRPAIDRIMAGRARPIGGTRDTIEYEGPRVRPRATGAGAIEFEGPARGPGPAGAGVGPRPDPLLPSRFGR